jgi:hypothetical protein
MVKIKGRQPGQITAGDIILAVATQIALATGPGRLEIEYKFGRDHKADEIVRRLICAVRAKLGYIDKHGNRTDVRERARRMVIGVLARKKRHTAFQSQIIAAFAESGDKDFLAALGRGFDERKPPFDEIEWFWIFHYGEMTDERVAERFGMTLRQVRYRRQNLGLGQ